MVFGFLFMIAIVGILFYVLVIYREVPGAMEQRLGVLEALPEELGKWKVDTDSEQANEARKKGLKREVRIWHDPGSGAFKRERLVRQVRYRNAANEIVHVDPEEALERKRIRQ